MSGTLYVGTSGFAYKEWKGVFYPEKTPDKEMLTHYSRLLPSVEINYTFRQTPSESTIEGWLQKSQDGFKFTLKAPQRITHSKRLKEVQEEVDDFLRRARGLGDRLGTILFQLPPNMRYDRERLERFLVGLPPISRYSLEHRNETWKTPEVAELLATHEVALCGADTEEQQLEEVPLTATGYAYLRLRKEEYTEAEIEGWAKRIREVINDGRDVYVYFKHEGGGVGPAYALALKERLA